jgi:ABC-2 type transport system ATP-binding protein
MQTTEWIIDVENLRKTFPGKIAVDSVSLQVKKGEIFGFLGPNGSGKTTFIRMLCGLLVPDSGSGHVLGYNILKDSYSIKRQASYMAQHFSLYTDLSVYENLDFIARIYDIKNRKQEI